MIRSCFPVAASYWERASDPKESRIVRLASAVFAFLGALFADLLLRPLFVLVRAWRGKEPSCLPAQPLSDQEVEPPTEGEQWGPQRRSRSRPSPPSEPASTATLASASTVVLPAPAASSSPLASAPVLSAFEASDTHIRTDYDSFAKPLREVIAFARPIVQAIAASGFWALLPRTIFQYTLHREAIKDLERLKKEPVPLLPPKSGQEPELSRRFGSSKMAQVYFALRQRHESLSQVLSILKPEQEGEELGYLVLFSRAKKNYQSLKESKKKEISEKGTCVLDELDRLLAKVEPFLSEPTLRDFELYLKS